jgi:site-specific recombinase XerD
MTAIAASVQRFFTQRLIQEQNASPATITAYRDGIRLWLRYAAEHTGTPISRLDFADLNTKLLLGFLTHLETERGNSTRTRNARLAAIHAFAGFAQRFHPEHTDDLARLLAVSTKKTVHTTVVHLDDTELRALIGACDPATVTDRRDRTMIHLAAQTGLRAGELLALTAADLHLGPGPHVSCHGKGRKTRITPLTPDTVQLLRAHLDEHHPGATGPVFTTSRGAPLSRDGLALRLTLHAANAATNCPSLAGKRITPHVLRHTAAMRLLHAGVDIAVIALWLGHESLTTTAIYVKADLEAKQNAIARTAPIGTPPGRFQPDDELLAFLDTL